MAYRTDNRHSTRFLVRKFLRKVRASLDETIAAMFDDRSRAAI